MRPKLSTARSVSATRQVHSDRQTGDEGRSKHEPQHTIRTNFLFLVRGRGRTYAMRSAGSLRQVRQKKKKITPDFLFFSKTRNTRAIKRRKSAEISSLWRSRQSSALPLHDRALKRSKREIKAFCAFSISEPRKKGGPANPTEAGNNVREASKTASPSSSVLAGTVDGGSGRRLLTPSGEKVWNGQIMHHSLMMSRALDRQKTLEQPILQRITENDKGFPVKKTLTR